MSAVPRIAIVTGAGSGIGRVTAQALSADGWSVVLAGRRAEALADTAAQCGGPPTLCVSCDVTDAASVDALFAAATQRFGRVDLLFNNAGITVPSVPLDELPVDKLRSIIDINLFGAMLCARAAMRVMKAQRPQGGRIINNGSVSAYAPRRYSSAYSATKTAITGLTKSIGLDGREAGIACCQIDIGNAATDLSQKMQTGMPQADGRIAPEPRMSSEHVARTIVHMANLPPDANMPFVTIMATGMPLYGRG